MPSRALHGNDIGLSAAGGLSWRLLPTTPHFIICSSYSPIQYPTMSYIMVDFESDGPIPGDYSMICFGAVVV